MLDEFAPLETARLRLEPIDPETARSIMRGDVAHLEPAEGWPQPGTVMGVTLAIEHGHPPGWLVRSSGRVIGDCGIRAPVDDAGCVEIGYGLAAPERGKGYGTELAAAISDWLLAQPSVSAVRASTEPSNTPSRRVLEKAGFSLVGEHGDLTIYERRA